MCVGLAQHTTQASIRAEALSYTIVFCSAGLHGRQWPGKHSRRGINPRATRIHLIPKRELGMRETCPVRGNTIVAHCVSGYQAPEGRHKYLNTNDARYTPP
ncbi:MAG TPA: hypothetical protein VJ440_12650 [Candidatus Brocadiaceae bacterium]|nr:hypothetical protein [Candidatus Brocadiaceae bacterium]